MLCINLDTLVDVKSHLITLRELNGTFTIVYLANEKNPQDYTSKDQVYFNLENVHIIARDDIH